MLNIINSLAPVFLLIVLGSAVHRSGAFGEDFFSGIVKVAYYIAIPCLLFYKLATADLAEGSPLLIFWVILAGLLFSILCAYASVKLIGVPTRSVGAYIQGSFRGNVAFVGFPVIFYTLGERAVSVAIISLGFSSIIYNITSVIVLLYHQPDRKDLDIWKSIFRPISKNPIVAACIIGILYNLTGAELPVLVHRTCEALGDLALPLALISIGSNLDFNLLATNLKVSSAASVINVAVGPLVGYLMGLLIGLGQFEMQIAVILLASPTAVSSYILAEMLGNDGLLAKQIVVMSTIMSLISLSIAVALL